MVEKGAEFPPGDPRRKLKYRVILRGGDVRNQSFEVALFQDMATAPAAPEAIRYCDLMSLLPDQTVEYRDVEQANLLASMEGSATYIVLPTELWAPEMHKMRRPVVLLENALYATL